jgi:hypothetical protein
MRLLIVLAIIVVAYLAYRGLSAPHAEPRAVIEKPAEVVESASEVKIISGKTALELAGGIVVLGALLIAAAFLL